MTVKLYTFAKKDDSTAQPSGAGTSFSCVLKDASGILAPTIRLDPSIGNPRSYNYAYIADFGRYYFVREWTYFRGEWEATLEVDALASWKTAIGSTSAYVLRSATTANWNKAIVDNKYPTLGVTNHLVTDGGASGPFSSMSYVIGTVGDPAGSGVSTVGGVNYYWVNQPDATNIFKWLIGHGASSYISDLDNLFNNFADDLFLATYNPVQYITTVKFFPISASGAPGATNFVIGKVSYSIANLHTFNWPVQTLGPYTLAIPKHPAIAARGEYLSNSPFSIYVFELQPYGRIELDGSMLAKADTLSYEVRVDLVSGDSLLFLTATGTGYSVSLGVFPGKAGTDIQISQITSNITQTAVNGVFRAASSAMQDNWFGVAEAAISAGMDSKFQASIRGSEGSFLVSDLTSTPKLHLYYKDVADEDQTHFGVPICKKLTISTLSGYVLCAEGDVAAAATQEELDTIRSKLTSGFYYE